MGFKGKPCIGLAEAYSPGRTGANLGLQGQQISTAGAGEPGREGLQFQGPPLCIHSRPEGRGVIEPGLPSRAHPDQDGRHGHSKEEAKRLGPSHDLPPRGCRRLCSAGELPGGISGGGTPEYRSAGHCVVDPAPGTLPPHTPCPRALQGEQPPPVTTASHPF